MIKKIKLWRIQREINALSDELTQLIRDTQAEHGPESNWPLHRKIRRNDLRKALAQATKKREQLEDRS